MLPDLTLGQIKKCRKNFAISLSFNTFIKDFMKFITDEKIVSPEKNITISHFKAAERGFFYSFRAQCPALFVLILRALSFKQNKVIILYVLPTLLRKVKPSAARFYNVNHSLAQ